MTTWFQSTWLGPDWGWFFANLILILLIALPLMLADRITGVQIMMTELVFRFTMPVLAGLAA